MTTEQKARILANARRMLLTGKVREGRVLFQLAQELRMARWGEAIQHA